MPVTTCDVCDDEVMYDDSGLFTGEPELCQSCLDIAAIMALSTCNPPAGGWPAGMYFADGGESTSSETGNGSVAGNETDTSGENGGAA